VSAWLERLHTLVPATYAGSVSSDSSDSSQEPPPNGANGAIGAGIEPQNGVPEPDPIAWHERPDVRLVVEDLFRERWHPDRISRELGLTRDEVRTILRRRS
jgi:hypothetical protein